MNKIIPAFLIILVSASTFAFPALASTPLKLLQQGVPVNVIEIDKEAIRNKSQNFQAKKIVLTTKKDKIKHKKKDR